MDIKLNELPNNVDSLKKIILNSASKIQLLEDEIKILKHKIFGSKSKKTKSENLLNLFNETEMDQHNDQKADDPKEKALEIKPHKRKKPTGRKPLSDSLPRGIVEYDLNPEDKTCKHCEKNCQG